MAFSVQLQKQRRKAIKKPLFQRIKNFFIPEQRGMTNSVGGWDWFNSWFGSSESESGETVSVVRGSKIETVFSCINALSQDIAKLPYNVRQDTSKGKVIIKNTVYRLIHSRPNSYTSAFNFWYNIVFNMLSWGNGYAYIKRGIQLELIILHPNDVQVLVFESEVWYQVKGVMIPAMDMLHYKLYSFDGILGVSPIIHNANVIGHRIKQEKYSAKVLGQKPPGVLTSDLSMTGEQIKQNREMWNSQVQGENIGGTPMLSGGLKYQPLMINPAEGQMIEASELSDERIMGLYRVPPTIIQNYRRATFSNAEQQDLVYSKYAITPITRAIEQETDFKLLTEREKTSDNPPYTKFNIKAMLQGDIKTQTEYYKFLRSSGMASANTILDLEDMPPLEGEQGDIVVIQGAFVPLDQIKEFHAKNGQNPGENSGERQQIGFDIQAIKEHLERLEIQNQS